MKVFFFDTPSNMKLKRVKVLATMLWLQRGLTTNGSCIDTTFVTIYESDILWVIYQLIIFFFFHYSSSITQKIEETALFYS